MPVRKMRHSIWPPLAILAAIAVLLGLQYKFGIRPFSDVLRELGLFAAISLGMFSTFVAGTFLYFFRCRWPFWYGFLEILVGFLGASYVASQLIEPTGGRGMLVFAEIAALYVIVRGWDNIARGIAPGNPKEDFDRFFFGRKLTE